MVVRFVKGYIMDYACFGGQEARRVTKEMCISLPKVEKSNNGQYSHSKDTRVLRDRRKFSLETGGTCNTNIWYR